SVEIGGQRQLSRAVAIAALVGGEALAQQFVGDTQRLAALAPGDGARIGAEIGDHRARFLLADLAGERGGGDRDERLQIGNSGAQRRIGLPIAAAGGGQRFGMGEAAIRCVTLDENSRISAYSDALSTRPSGPTAPA